MRATTFRRWVWTALSSYLALTPLHLGAFVPDDRWTFTSHGPTDAPGSPITLTWSLVPDGTPIPGEGTSDLIAFLDGHFGQGPGGADLQLRPWFDIIAGSLERWSELGGVTFAYESNDDGLSHGQFAGRSGVRGDIRLAGTYLDGDSGTLAYSGLPNNSDLVLDTGDDDFYANPAGNYLRMRNTIMHEIGHGLGLFHVESDTERFLLEPFVTIAIDGPQFDDIRGLHWFYGDAWEKSGGSLQNDTLATATELGAITTGETLAIGRDTGFDTVVSPPETDFVSITDQFDVDYYSFAVDYPLQLDATLLPVGATYVQGIEGGAQTEIDTASIADLTLTLFGVDGTTELAVANQEPAGVAEHLSRVALTSAGEYFVRIEGDAEVVQFYELQLTAYGEPVNVLGDYNANGVVDAADYTVWRDSQGSTTILDADGNGNGVVDAADYAVWRDVRHLAVASSISGVPEPSSLGMLLLAVAVARVRRSVGR